MDDKQREEMLDRLMHQTLEEKLGTARPCDVADKFGGVSPLQRTRLVSRTWFRVSVVAASAAAIVVGVVAFSDPVPTFTSSRLNKTSLADARKEEGKKAERLTDDEIANRLVGTPPVQVLGQHAGTEGFDVLLGGENESDRDVADVLAETIDADWIAEHNASKARKSSSDDKAMAMAIDLPKSATSTAPSTQPSEGFGGGDRESGGRYASAGRGASTKSESTVEKYRRTPNADAYALDVLEERVNSASDFAENEFSDPLGSRRSIDKDGDGIAKSESGRFARHPDTGEGRDRFARLHDNRFLTATAAPLSTFSIDVDTASYSVVRSRIENRMLPPPEAVRVEELVNYFAYDYPQPTDGAPFAVHVDVAACPWATKHRLVRIGLKGKEIPNSERPASNLVFLVDVSGSMRPANKLPLVRQGLLRLIDQLDERDRVAIVVYAGSSGCVLASTPCTQANKERVRSAVGGLQSGGSTNGAAGIELAYQIAQDHFVRGGANRVILCTDGDFNVGASDDETLKRMVADRAKGGVFLTALGFGMGNHNDQMLEAIADNGNGAYGYIDDQREVEKLFVRQLSGTLITIAKDVKIQVEFNPAQVGAYRLIGYENRILAKEDFNNDKKDAGDIGAGHTVTALYEIVPVGVLAEASAKNAAASDDNDGAAGGVDRLEFQRPKQELELTDAAKTSGDLLLVKLRYKAPDGEVSTLIRTPAKDNGATFAAAANDFKFAASVAAMGMILRQSPFRGNITLAAIEEIATANIGEDTDGQRKEFVNLVRQTRGLAQGLEAGE